MFHIDLLFFQETHLLKFNTTNTNKDSNEEWKTQKGKAYKTVQHRVDIPKLLIIILHDFHSLIAAHTPSKNK